MFNGVNTVCHLQHYKEQTQSLWLNVLTAVCAGVHYGRKKWSPVKNDWNLRYTTWWKVFNDWFSSTWVTVDIQAEHPLLTWPRTKSQKRSWDIWLSLDDKNKWERTICQWSYSKRKSQGNTHHFLAHRAYVCIVHIQSKFSLQTIAQVPNPLFSSLLASFILFLFFNHSHLCLPKTQGQQTQSSASSDGDHGYRNMPMVPWHPRTWGHVSLYHIWSASWPGCSWIDYSSFWARIILPVLHFWLWPPTHTKYGSLLDVAVISGYGHIDCVSNAQR